MLTWQDFALLPIYLHQSYKVRRDTIRLPEPMGDRKGITTISNVPNPLNVLVLGDSAGAGVGVTHQSDAFLGQFVAELSQNSKIKQKFGNIYWQLQATTGHTSFDLLKRLYTLPAITTDVAVISIGVNDITNRMSVLQWQTNIQDIIEILQRKFTTRHIIFASIPPMQLMPALPSPLNRLLGRMASHLDDALQQQCKKNISQNGQKVHYLFADFQKYGLNERDLFAKDGFHPSNLTYKFWSKTVVEFVVNELE